MQSAAQNGGPSLLNGKFNFCGFIFILYSAFIFNFRFHLFLFSIPFRFQFHFQFRFQFHIKLHFSLFAISISF